MLSVDGRMVCTDNYFSSIPFAEELLQHRTYLIGILRANRKALPNDVSKARLKKGEVVARENSAGIVVLKGRDQRDVMILTTIDTHTLYDYDAQDEQKCRYRYETGSSC